MRTSTPDRVRTIFSTAYNDSAIDLGDLGVARDLGRMDLCIQRVGYKKSGLWVGFF